MRLLSAQDPNTPKTAVQGSLVEHPKLQVETPCAAGNDIPGAILAQMQPGQEYSRAQLADALGLSVYESNMAIRELKESGRVVQTGEKRGARYRNKDAK